MRPFTMLAGSALALCGSALPLQAQKPHRTPPVLVTNPSAPTTAAPPSRAPSDSAGGKARRPPPTLVARPGVTVDSSRTTARNAAAQQAVSPQAAHPAAAPAPAFTAGLAIASYSGESDEDRDRYVRQFVTQLDSATATLVAVFRNASGQALAVADGPGALSSRERERWGRCRDLHFDLQTFAPAIHDLVDELPEEVPVQRAGHALDSSLAALQATAECDNITSMISAPDRWVPWGAQYVSSARSFYHDWYGQVRDVADKNRALVIAWNAARPAAARIPVPPALPRTPPYAGAAPR